jgi:preprotein translocase subunit SecG
MTSFFFYTAGVLFIIVCVFLILLILIQKGRGGGLASAFGGSGGNTAFGSKTGDVLTWATSIVFGVFVVLAVTMNLIANHMDSKQPGANPTGPGGPGTSSLPISVPASSQPAGR